MVVNPFHILVVELEKEEGYNMREILEPFYKHEKTNTGSFSFSKPKAHCINPICMTTI